MYLYINSPITICIPIYVLVSPAPLSFYSLARLSNFYPRLLTVRWTLTFPFSALFLPPFCLPSLTLSPASLSHTPRHSYLQSLLYTCLLFLIITLSFSTFTLYSAEVENLKMNSNCIICSIFLYEIE